ncbi:hypothetical protein [Rhodococcus sp. BS-15]|uniref:hypothetical protein n=1 Tax=Rhodococcus sp. BS-15 TaxID=1304954 RepID=UPI001F30A5B1|nr:hypothetical protein [Rhodococcus sp. BS-15]
MPIDPAVRMSRLQALIDHPRTGISERDVAQRMLNRLFRSMRSTAGSSRQYGSNHGRLGRHAGLEDVAEMIRYDLLLARPDPAEPHGLATVDPVADAPADIQYEVEARHDCEIVVTISGVPTAWGWQHDDGIDVHSPALSALVDEIAVIVNSYNHFGDDITHRFFGRVRVEGQTVVW